MRKRSVFSGYVNLGSLPTDDHFNGLTLAGNKERNFFMVCTPPGAHHLAPPRAPLVQWECLWKALFTFSVQVDVIKWLMSNTNLGQRSYITYSSLYLLHWDIQKIFTSNLKGMFTGLKNLVLLGLSSWRTNCRTCQCWQRFVLPRSCFDFV